MNYKANITHLKSSYLNFQHFIDKFRLNSSLFTMYKSKKLLSYMEVLRVFVFFTPTILQLKGFVSEFEIFYLCNLFSANGNIYLMLHFCTIWFHHNLNQQLSLHLRWHCLQQSYSTILCSDYLVCASVKQLLATIVYKNPWQKYFF